VGLSGAVEKFVPFLATRAALAAKMAQCRVGDCRHGSGRFLRNGMERVGQRKPALNEREPEAGPALELGGSGRAAKRVRKNSLTCRVWHSSLPLVGERAGERVVARDMPLASTLSPTLSRKRERE
jgi:hypothetical protein